MSGWWGYRSVSAQDIRRLRRRLKLTQAEFAARYHVCRRTVVRWEQKGVEFHQWIDSGKQFENDRHLIV